MTEPDALRSRTQHHFLLVTGMSGAGKTTALHTFEDMGWETVDNLPLSLFERLFDAPVLIGGKERSLAIGIDSRTRGFSAEAIVERIKAINASHDLQIETLFLDCGDAELERRFSETRRRHPLAQDRPATQGIGREREMLIPLRRWADHLIDTSESGANALQHELRERFGRRAGGLMTISLLSFGFARGMPRNADLVFDMRFLRNPHWDPVLKPGTGLDEPVGAYISEDPAYAEAMERIEGLLALLLPRYQAEGKSYVTIGFGCTGGRHRSVHVAERMAARLRADGFSPTVAHRDLASLPHDGVEGASTTENKGAGD